MGQSSAAEPPETNERIRTDAYGDPLPKGARFRLGTVRLRHDDAAWSVAWLPDGRTLASSSRDKTVRLWRIPGGKQLARWDNLESIHFSPDGQTFNCRGKQGAIRIHDLATGTERRRVRVSEKNIAFGYELSPDGRFLTGMDEDQKVHLHVAESGKEIYALEGKARLECPMAFSPDSRTLIVEMEDSGLCCWQTATGKKLQTPGYSWSSSATFSPDGKMLAAVIKDKGSDIAHLWSWPECKELLKIDLTNVVFAVLAFSPDSKVVAIGGEESIRLLDPRTGKEFRRLGGHKTRVLDLSFSPDGSLLASAGEDGVVTVWEVRATNNPRLLTGVGHRLLKVAMANGGRTLLTLGPDGALTLWDGRSGRRVRTVASPRSDHPTLVVSPDGSRALVLPWLNEEPEWWDLTTGRRLPGISGPSEHVEQAAFSPDSSLLALGGFDGISGFIDVRETVTGRPLRRLQEGKNAEGVAVLTFSPDGRTLAIVRSDGSLTLWDFITNRPLRRLIGPREGIGPIAFSADSRLLAAVCSQTRIIHLYETASGQEIPGLDRQPAPIRALAFAPDNRTLAAGGGRPFEPNDECPDPAPFPNIEAAIRLWDVPSRKHIHLLQGHREGVHTLAFSSDGDTLVSGSYDETVLSWDVAAVTRRYPAGKSLSADRLTFLWTDLAARDAARAQRAVAELIQAPDAALPFLEKALPPVPREKMTPIAAWIADLDHEQFARRERASRELEKIGEYAAPALRKVLNDKPSLEVRKRIDALLEAIDGRPISPDRLRTLRALQVLETIGTPKAKQILQGLASGAAEAALTQEAKAALQRLSRRNASH
jgi:WD40 repeat protein